MAEDWKLQVSYKTPAGDMINRYGSTNPATGWTDMSTRPSQVQVGNLKQDGKSIRDVGLSDASGRGPVQASQLIPEQFPF